jgi:predicted alpha/beta hydrolase family esterase
MQSPNVILVHGNSGANAEDLWLPSVKESLEELDIETVAQTMPDNLRARESIWIPYLINNLHIGENSIVVGHSSGAVAAMRLAETQRLLGSVLVGANHTDLGDALERKSGYFSRPWKWDKIRENQDFIIQFASTDDPFVPIEEARHIHEQLDSDYHEFSDKGHFGGDREMLEFPELVSAVQQKLASLVVSH